MSDLPHNLEAYHPNTYELSKLASGPIARSLGNVSLAPSVSAEIVHAPLPEGYRYENSEDIEPIEVARLFQRVELGQEIPDDYLTRRAKEIAEAGMGVINVGVRSPDGKLASFGSIAYQGGVGEMCDFVTSPDHQGVGIGKAVIDERLRLAEAANVSVLIVPDFQPTNTLKSYYLEKGFVESPDGGLQRTPASVEQLQAQTTLAA